MNNRLATTYLPRDFVETTSGLLFAVVAHGLESQRLLAFLRYVRDGAALRKLGTSDANELLGERHPEYLFHSPQRDVLLHGVPTDRIVAHHRPRARLAQLLQTNGLDPFEQKVVRVARMLTAGTEQASWLGVTGSVLVGAHHEWSDIDLVIYDRAAFEQVRQRVGMAIGQVESLDDAMWRETYRRRGCSLTFDEYLWHERRKLNKFMWEGTKVDLSYVGPELGGTQRRGRKLEQRRIEATVVESTHAFTYPARYQIDHPDVLAVVSYNPTYTGQATVGERIEAAGWIEQLADSQRQLVVGTSREAPGEYIKVVRRSGASGGPIT